MKTSLGINSSREFDPSTFIPWQSCYWAGSPTWANPGDGNDVTAVPDLGSDGNDLYSVDATYDMTFDAANAAFNNKPTINSNSSAYFRQTNTMTLSQPFVAVFILRTSNTNCMFTDSAGANRIILSVSTTPNYRMNAGAVYTVGSYDTNPHFIVCHFNSTSSYAVLDGSTVATANAGSLGVNSAFFFGASKFHTFQWAGEFAFIGLCPESTFTTYSSRFDDLERWTELEYGITMA